MYAEADALFEGWSCTASTDCCRFAVTGREPYVTSVELATLRRAFEATGRRPVVAPVARRRGLARVDDERRCPMLGPDGRCVVYQARPLGCRTFWCERATAAGRVRHAAVGELVRRIQGIAARHTAGGDRGRPLTRALAERDEWR